MTRLPPRDGGWSDEATVQALVTAREQYSREVSPHYDEALQDVIKRADQHRSVSKLDLGGLLLWKRLGDYRRWASRLNDLSDEEVRAITGTALAAARDTLLRTPDAAGLRPGQRCLALRHPAGGGSAASRGL